MIREKLIKEFELVLDSGKYILGPKVEEFEAKFAKYIGTSDAVGMANGTCTLQTAIKSLGFKYQDEIIVPANSFVASASSVYLAGQVPVLADVEDDLNISPESILENITSRTRAIMVVHLAGRPANMRAISKIAKDYNLLIIEDSAQSVGATYYDVKIGSFGSFASFSLHPLKNLHAYGDAGIITTNDKKLAESLKTARNHGLLDRESCSFFSSNCRLDELQAALLCVQLDYLEGWTNERITLATYYNQALQDIVEVPISKSFERHVYQTYVIKADNRDELLNHLRSRGIEASIHYKNPIHRQAAFINLGLPTRNLQNVERLSRRIMSLPLYPGMKIEQVDYIVNAIKEFHK